jgi:DegV family protein with EDD domain
MSVRISVDSTADLIPPLKERVTAVPLTVHFGEKEYVDGVTITAQEFYKKLESAKELPSTSQATPYAFSEAFEEAVEAGDTVVAVILSSGLSGTYQSAVIGASEFPGKVFVVDSRNVALSAGIMVEYAFRLLEQGMDAEQIAAELTDIRSKAHLMAVVDTLEYLQKGGRVSKAVAIAGGMLFIKPIIATNAEGKIEIVGKARGNKQANALMNKKAQELEIDFSKPVMVGYTGTSDALLQKYLAESAEFFGENTYGSSVVSAVVGTHAGPNAVALAFFSK